MTTTIAEYKDAIRPDVILEIYQGTAGLCLLLKGDTKKFWIKEEDRQEIAAIIGEYQ